MEASRALFDSLKRLADVRELIDDGETESLRLECKCPRSPKVNVDVRKHLAKAASAFANSAGGVLLYGVATDKIHGDSLDVLTDIQPIGGVETFARRITDALPQVTEPAVNGFEVRVIKSRPSSLKGLVAVHVPSVASDPVRTEDGLFFFRSGNESVQCPYDVIRRLFAASKTPDLAPDVDKSLANRTEDGSIEFTLWVANASGAIAQHIVVRLKLMDPDSCESAEFQPLGGEYKPILSGKDVFCEVDGVIHKGLMRNAGTVRLRLKPRRRIVRLKTALYANHMMAREHVISLRFAGGLLASREVGEARDVI